MIKARILKYIHVGFRCFASYFVSGFVIDGIELSGIVPAEL